MKYFTSIVLLLLFFNVNSQNLTLEHGFQIDEALVGLDYIFGDVPESVLYFNHKNQLSDPVSDHSPADGMDASFYLMEDGVPSFSFSLDSGKDSVRIFAIGSNEEFSTDYIYFECGSNIKAIGEDKEILFDLDLKDSVNHVLLHIDNTDEILVSYLKAPENTISKIIPMEDATLISGSFRDTLTYTDPEGIVHKYFTNDIFNGFLLSLDVLGKPQWIHTSRAVGYSIVRSVSVSNVIAYAHDVIFGTQLDILNLDGDTLSTRYLNNVTIMHMEAFEDKSIAMCGTYYRTNNIPDMDFGPGELILPDPKVKDGFVIKYDSDLNAEWFDIIGGDAIDTATKFDFDEEGGLYLTGCIEEDGVFNNGDEIFISQGMEDIFLTHYNAQGDYQWSKVWGGTGTDIGLNIHVEDLQIYLSGVFMDTIDFDLSDDLELIFTDNVDSLEEAFFFTVYSMEGPSHVGDLTESTMKIFPNPFTDRITFEEALLNIELYTITGKLLLRNDYAEDLNLHFLPSGSYLLKGKNKKGHNVSKLIMKQDQ